MTYDEFKKLDEFDKMMYIKNFGYKVGLFRCMNGGGSITKSNSTLKYQNREKLMFAIEEIFLKETKNG